MMRKKSSVWRSGVALGEIVLIVSLSFTIAFLISEEAGVVSAQGFIAGTSAADIMAKAAAQTSAAQSPIQTTWLQRFATQKGSIGATGETTSAQGFGIGKSIGDLAGGRATFGFKAGSTSAGVAGALGQGLFWGGVLYGGIKLLAPLLGVGKETTNALATAALVGGLSGGVIKATLVYLHGSAPGSPGIWSLTAGQAGFFGGLAIAAVVFLVIYKKEKKQLVRFECLPWEPPLKGEKCEECNKDTQRPCTEYRCKALGQGCQLLNPNTGKEQCTWVSKFDVESPKIQPWTEPLVPRDARYVPDTAVRPPAIGTKIVANNGGCLPAFTPLQFGITTNEPAQCRLDYNHTQKFDEMQFFFGGDNYYAYNHTQKMRLPGPGADTELAPLLRNDGAFSLYVRCRDANGNENVDEYSMSFCVAQGPDTTPPIIEGTSIASGSPVQYKVDQIPLEVYVNEPSECRWSTQSKAYEDMEHVMGCANDVSQFNTGLSYTCSTNLTGIKDREENKFYFRCKDQPGKSENERNVMVQSHELLLQGSQSLTIDAVSPNSTLSGSTSVVPVVLRVQTSNGAEEGKATCSFSNKSSPAKDFIPMFNTGSHEHSQELTLPAGTYTTHFRCVDAGGNVVTTQTSFAVSVDKQAPSVTRVYRDQALKVTTDEEAECRYSTTSCNFAIKDGLRMQYQSVDTKTRHFADWKPGVTYYIRCVDNYGNEPNPATCSVIARPIELEKAANT
jgi:hypothetical protein